MSAMAPLLHVRVEAVGAVAFDHDLACWLCQERPAVYCGDPHWVFAPCWECQRAMAMANPDAWWPALDRPAPRRPWWRHWRRDASWTA